MAKRKPITKLPKREIKFRIWNKKTKKMSIGFTIQDLIRDYFVFNGELDEADFDDFILMQYTGLKDKNGKEIYEGDIVEYNKYGYRKFIRREVVMWGEYDVGEYFGGLECWIAGDSVLDTPISLLVKDSIAEYAGDRADKNGVRVIGNIFENPELSEEYILPHLPETKGKLSQKKRKRFY